MQKNDWRVKVDRGGTFTDIIGIHSSGKTEILKLLSDDSDHYSDAVVFGLEQLRQKIKQSRIVEVRMGTTVATNALLEMKGAKTALLVTDGFTDLLTIRTQHRRHLFQQNIKKVKPVYHRVIGINERMDANGKVIVPLESSSVERLLSQLHEDGVQSIAVCLLHSDLNPEHELLIEKLAQQFSFSNVSISYKVNPFPKYLPRTETTLIDAYLTPILNHYTKHLQSSFPSTQFLFMKSNGDLTSAIDFSGKDAILSGPAGGIVAMSKTAEQAGFEMTIGFDMGGTSTDVSLFLGHFDKSVENTINDQYIRAPMLDVYTVAAGGGSKLTWQDNRLQVGPESSGAFPGPVCYGHNGELSVTDLNVVLGKIRPEYFPKVFGKDAKQPIEYSQTIAAFQSCHCAFSQQSDTQISEIELAHGFMSIAINSMANAIRKISTAKGIELDQFILNAFGGAGAQHACLVADELGIESILIHPQSSVLSAYGMGCGYQGQETRIPILKPFNDLTEKEISLHVSQTIQRHSEQLNTSEQLVHHVECGLHVKNSDTLLYVNFQNYLESSESFKLKFIQQFGFFDDKQTIILHELKIETKIVETLQPIHINDEAACIEPNHHVVQFESGSFNTPFYSLPLIEQNKTYNGPLIAYDQHTTLVVEPGWQLRKTSLNHCLLERKENKKPIEKNETSNNPIRLEIFNHLFMHIAEQMGYVLQKTALSVNIKERLDYSCALFDVNGALVANAPHMPVHLGSMSASVQWIIQANSEVNQGDVFMMNSPYKGGTHLPDITVISPVFIDNALRFWVGSRGHHADIGGITPGSMPGHSKHIDEEGIVFENFRLVSQGTINEEQLIQHLLDHSFPARNPQHILADLKAQVAANQRGINELISACLHFGTETVSAYMSYVQKNAQSVIEEIIAQLPDNHFEYTMDCGALIKVKLEKINPKKLRVDFSGSSQQMANNFNAPLSVTRAAIMYVLRSLVEKEIPLNDGCLAPIELIIPEGTFLNPTYPAALVAGNVETSQCVTDALFGALNLQAGAQGTMNNLTFGDETLQYYETIAGGSGAGRTLNGQFFCGADGIQTHMTNSRMTDPEILERHYPVRLDAFTIRKNSGGKGRFNGGNGLIRRITFLKPLTLSLLTNNRTHQPYGLNGGESGQLGLNRLIKKNGTIHSLAYCCEVNVDAGDSLEIQTPGGGGYGKTI